MRVCSNRLVLLALLLCAGPPALAQQEAARSSSHSVYLAQKEAAGPRISMAEAMEIVRRSTGGRVLNAQEAQRGGREGYRIKVLIGSGEVRVFFVDARSGSMQQD